MEQSYSWQANCCLANLEIPLLLSPSLPIFYDSQSFITMVAAPHYQSFSEQNESRLNLFPTSNVIFFFSISAHVFIA
jgi:hypothetical protein